MDGRGADAVWLFCQGIRRSLVPRPFEAKEYDFYHIIVIYGRFLPLISAYRGKK